MRSRTIVLLLVVFSAVTAFAQSTGRVSGTITKRGGAGIAGVVVSIDGLGMATTTDASGAFSFDAVPAGTHTISFTAADQVETATVDVAAGQRATVSKEVDWQLSFADAITVYSASRQAERIVEAPAAVSVVPTEEIVMAAPTGQVPRMIESAPGVDFTQSGMYDFNFNTRGFNSSLNRRILTLIDGRDPSVPFLGAQEWAAVSFPLDEMESVELVRGPGSALYGANAFSGVLNMTTKRARASEGGKIQVAGGDLDTKRIDARYGGGLGGDWFFRIVGGYQQSEDFAQSRNATVEYSHICGPTESSDCLRREARPLALDENEIMYAGLRLDKMFSNSNVLTTEAGFATLEGPIFQTGIGRVQVTDVSRPWARVNYSTAHFNALAYWDARDADEQVALASGALLFEDSRNLHAELQTNWNFAGTRGRFVGGVAYNDQSVDTSNPAGVHTLMAEEKEEQQQAAFAQVSFAITDSLEAVVAGRYDDSTLHESQVSPKAALVYEITPNQTMRLTYNEAFQIPNYSEFFLRAPAGQPVNLSALETALRPVLGGVSLGFSSIPVLALGNAELDVEEITSYELGYSSILGGKVYFTADYYQSKIQNFVTDLLPGVNPAFPAYRPPSVLPAPVQAAILAQLQRVLPARVFAGMTNLGTAPAIVFSYTNAGEVDTQGIELAVNYYLTNSWVLDANYSWFDFEVQEQQLGDVLLPNAPEHKFNVGVGYRTAKFDASLKYRWVDDFYWAAGVFQGPVESYGVLNLAGNYHVTNRFTIGLNVANALDDEHHETWGGDIVERRALVSAGYSF